MKVSLKQYQLIYFLSVFSNIVFILFSFSFLDKEGFNVLINSDTLYLPSLFHDITSYGGSFKDWCYGAAPNFFPDVPLFFIASYITKNLVASTILFSIIQVVLFIGLTNGILKAVFPKKERLQILICGNILLSLLPLSTYFGNDFQFSFHLISNAFHNGAFLNTLIGLNFLVRLIKRFSFLNFFLLLFIIFIATISDRLFMAYFIVPAVVMIFVAIKRDWKYKLTLLITLPLSAYFSLLLIGSLIANKHLYTIKKEVETSYELFETSYRIFFEQMNHYFFAFDSRSLALLFTVSFFLLMLFFLIKNIKHNLFSKTISDNYALYTFLFSFIIITTFAPIALGIYSGWDTLRYSYPAIIIGVLFFGLTINYSNTWVKKYLPILLVVSFSGLFLSAITIGLSSKFYSGLSKTINFYPDRVKTIEELIQPYNVEYGIATYWDANYTMLLSKRKLRTYQCYSEMNPWYATSNQNWFYYNSSTQDSVTYNFVIIKDEKHQKHFKKLLGDPLHVLDSNDVKIYITKPFRFSQTTYEPYYVNK